jgi:putative endonuclease
MTYYTYIIKSTVDGSYFFGQTKNLLKRLNEHNRGLEEKTKAGRPWVLVAHKELSTRNAAMGLNRKLNELSTVSEVESFIKEYNFTKV